MKKKIAKETEAKLNSKRKREEREKEFMPPDGDEIYYSKHEHNEDAEDRESNINSNDKEPKKKNKKRKESSEHSDQSDI